MVTKTAFEAELMKLITRHIESDTCRGCMARDLILASVVMITKSGELCCPPSQHESASLIKSLVTQLSRLTDDHDHGKAILPSGTRLQ